jgi:uncharacterized protein (TIGR03435 family)
MHRHNRLRIAALVVLLAAPLVSRAATQDVSARDLPRFEVVSIKILDANTPHVMGIHVYPGGRLEISGFSLKTMIATAFDLGFLPISGGDEWTDKEIYFVTAKPPAALASSIESIRYTNFGIDDPVLRQMLQALLIDRFQLKAHRDVKTGDVYLLKRNDKPLALKAAEVPGGAAESKSFGSIGYVNGRWSLFATTMPQLAKFAAGPILHAPVLDRTELEGGFDFRQLQPDLEPRYGGDQSDSFRDFLSQAGLKLERSRGPVESLVIDSAAHPALD